MKKMQEFVDQTEDTLNWLETDYKLKMPEGSPIRIIFDLMRAEREKCLRYGIAASGDMKPHEVRAFFGLCRICDRLAQVRAIKSIPLTFFDHIRKLDVALPSQASRYDDIPHKLKPQTVTKASDALFELTVALAALTKYDTVEIEPSGGAGIPDVCIDIEGIRWGFECKVSSHEATSAQSYYRLVKKGVDQLQEKIKHHKVDRGCVILSVQNIFQRQEGEYSSEADVEKELKRKHTVFSNSIQEHMRMSGALSLFQDKLSEPGIITYFEDVFLIVRARGGIYVPTPIGMRRTQGLKLYTPWSYAQHTTFDGSGLLPHPVVDTMLKALSGPNSFPINVP